MLDFLEKLLPTSQSRKLAAVAVPIFLAVPFLAEGLEKLGIRIDVLFRPKIRILLALSILSLSLFLIVVSLVYLFSRTSAEANTSQSKVSGLESEVASLRSELVNLKRSNASLTQQIQEIFGIYLNDGHKSALVSVASRSGSEASEIAKHAGLSEQDALDKLNYLESHRLVHGLTRTRYIDQMEGKRKLPQRYNTWQITRQGHACIGAFRLRNDIT